MSSHIINEDLRSIKTKKALYSAMFSLLQNQSFKQITIKGICEKALISRAAFYAHFIDKYDLLKYWIIELWPKDFNSNDSYEHIELIINSHINDNLLAIKNLVYEADNETLDIIFDFIISTININIERNNKENFSANIVLSNFFAGGIISYILWQIKNNFPKDVPVMNKHFYKAIKEFQKWQEKTKEN